MTPTQKDATFFQLLAHPLRIALLQYLASVPQATATECSRVLGASPSTFSWHLRLLARGGLVEPVEAEDGRTRPWRYIGPQNLQLPNREVAPLLQQALLRQERQVIDQFFRRSHQYPAEWRDAAAFTHSVLHLDVKQLQALQRAIEDVFEQFQTTPADDAKPPTLPQERVYAVFYAVPWFDH